MSLEEYLQEKYSPTAIKGYAHMIQRYRTVMGARAEEATYTEVLEYIGQLREQGLHPKSLKNHLFTIKIYYSYLIETGKRADHPCKYLQLKDQVNKQIAIENLYSREVLEALYESCKTWNTPNQIRDQVIISLLIEQALSVQEIIQLKVEDVNLEQGTIRIAEQVKNKGRTLTLKPHQILLLHHYIRKERKRYQRRPKPSRRTEYLLLNEEGLQLWQGSINRIINRGRDRSARLTPLRIRQSVIARLLKEDKDVRIVQEFAGHRRTASTEAYKQTGLEELKLAIDKLHPRKR